MQQLNIRAYYPAFLAMLFLFSACGEERFGLDYTDYEAPLLTDNDGAVTYQDLTTFPVPTSIMTAAPTFDYNAEYKFSIDTVKAPEGSSFVVNRFVIDGDSGAISYDNANNTLSMGDYVVSVFVQTITGLVSYTDAVRITVGEVPVTLSVDNALVDAGSLEQGLVATVSYTDNSAGGLITDVVFSLVDGPENFAIDAATGEISKTGALSEGPRVLTVRAVTNLGTVVAENLVTVNVGPAPTIAYVQQDGSTPLSMVTVSPYTAYTSASPMLEGMTAASWAVDLPDALTAFAASFSVDMDGAVVLAENAGLPEGTHQIGVTATNSAGVSLGFPDVFTLVVEFRWEAFFTDLIDSDDANVLPEAAYPGVWAGYDIEGDAGNGWQKVANVGGGNFSGMRRFNPGTLDGCLTRAIDITGVQALRISFGEMLGYGAAFTARYSRALYFGETTASLEGGSFMDGEWNALIAPDGPWLGTNWNGGTGPIQQYDPVNVDLAQVTGNTLYLNWRLFSNDVAAGNQNGQWIITDVVAERAAVFAAEEG